jgi:1-acyl-sn-glycerol-3-phosphate acyltransferase
MSRRRLDNAFIYQMTRAIVIPWAHLWFRWHIEGLSNIPQEGGAIVAFNHVAYVDPLCIGYVVERARRRPRFLAKAELFQDRRIAWILRGCGQVEVKRGTRSAPIALDRALEALEMGEVVVIFPEGTVTTDPDLHPGPVKTGISRLALKSGVPVIPCAIWGTANIWPKGYGHNWRPRQDVVVRIGHPMNITGDFSSPAAWQEAGKTIMAEISRLVAGLRPLVPDRRRPRAKSSS